MSSSPKRLPDISKILPSMDLATEQQLSVESGVRLTPIGPDLILLRVPLSYAANITSFMALTESEREVAACACNGLSNADIAERRGCSVRTVANQLSQAYRKLRLSGRRELRAAHARSHAETTT